MKKRIIGVIIAAALLVASMTTFCGCKDQNEALKEDIVIAVPDGGAALGMAYLLTMTSLDGHNVQYNIVDGAAGIKSAVMSGDADLAIMPTNIACNLYNNGIPIKLVATNSNGLLYLLGAGELENGISSLVGQIVYNVGLGGTPDIVMKYLIEDALGEGSYVESDVAVPGKVALRYIDSTTMLQRLKQGTISYGILGEPMVSVALANGGVSILADLQELWTEATAGEDENESDIGYPQTCLVAKTSVINKYPSLITAVYDYTVTNAAWLIEDSVEACNVLRAAGATVPAALSAAGLARCNFNPLKAADAATLITEYLQVLYDYQPSVIGGKMPDTGFLYQ